MKNPILSLFSAVLLCLLPSISLAVPAAPDVSEVHQPDGTRIEVQLKGDEWCNWVETTEGYTISKSADDYWYYVREYHDGAPVLDSTYAHEAPPDGLEKHIHP